MACLCVVESFNAMKYLSVTRLLCYHFRTAKQIPKGSLSPCLLPLRHQKKIPLVPLISTIESGSRREYVGSYSYLTNFFSNLAPPAHMNNTRTGSIDVPEPSFISIETLIRELRTGKTYSTL